MQGKKLPIKEAWIVNSKELYKQAYDYHYNTNEFSKALELYKQIISQFPESPEAGYSETQIENIENMSETEKTRYEVRELQSKMIPIGGDAKYVSTHESTRLIAQIVSFAGWIIVGISVLVGFKLIAASLELRHVGFSIYVLLPAFGGIIAGLIAVALGQITRATGDTADYCGEMLAIMKSKRTE